MLQQTSHPCAPSSDTMQVGITLVGSSSLLSGEGSQTLPVTQEQMLIGMALIIISQAVQVCVMCELRFEAY